MLREKARRETERVADAFSGAAVNEVTELAAFANLNIEKAARDPNPDPTLWRVIYTYDLGLLVLKRRGDRVFFPPEDPLAMPKMWEEKLRALTAIADLLRDGDFVNGWFPNIAGEYYFECRRKGAGAEREENCLALSSTQIFPTLFGVLDEFAAVTPGWAFRLRDPFDRIVWSKGKGDDLRILHPGRRAAWLGGGAVRRAERQRAAPWGGWRWRRRSPWCGCCSCSRRGARRPRRPRKARRA